MPSNCDNCGTSTPSYTQTKYEGKYLCPECFKASKSGDASVGEEASLPVLQGKKSPRIHRMVITGVDMPFEAMVGLMVKIGIAAIPTAIILGAAGFLAAGFLAASS